MTPDREKDIRARTESPEWYGLHARVDMRTLLAALDEARRAGPALVPTPCGATGETDLICEGCGETQSPPHTWRDCAKYLRESRDAHLGFQLDADRHLDAARREAEEARAESHYRQADLDTLEVRRAEAECEMRLWRRFAEAADAVAGATTGNAPLIRAWQAAKAAVGK